MGGEQALRLDDIFDFSELEKVDRFDDERIVRGLVTADEVNELENTLLRLYVDRAKREGKPFVTVTDAQKYHALKETKAIFDADARYLFIDETTHAVLDMVPVAYHLLDTKEGSFYAKLMQLP